jgi:outer membrane protein OmpA-like peptidoglycan-associated protein/tetratricopeptide (TPR) repeat protein
MKSKRIIHLIVFSVLSVCITALTAQEAADKERISAIQSADNSYYYDKDYERAASLYEPLLKANPGNSNIAAKLGICYLNMDGKKTEALELLKKASKNTATSAREYKKAGNLAPSDTYLYLAIAYHQNDSLEKAVSLYSEAKKKLTGEEEFQADFIDLQIRNCRYAMEMKKKPLRILSDLFAPWLIDYPGAINPVLAKNDSVFVFTVRQQGKTQVYCSYKSGKEWNRPSNITPQLGGFDRFYTNSITGDGKTLILFMDDGDDGNLYQSQRNDTTWSHIRSVGKFVNSIYWEDHGFITPDGKTMYFASNRPGGEGELDIWISQKLDDGTWDRPVNCGNVINTPYDENSPYYDAREDALIFSSTGHISMGGHDVFRSTARGGSWTQPVAMPYAFNNVLENTHFILNNNAPGFIASRYDEKEKARNIYAIVAVNPADELTRASGTIRLEDGLEVNPRLSLITVTNIGTGEVFQNTSVGKDGSFSFNIKPGDYEVLVSHDGYVTDTINLNLPLYYGGNFIPVNPVLVPIRVASGEFLSIKNILFDFSSYEISEDVKPTLESIRKILVSNPGLTVEIAGYTDAKGSNEFNRRLADRRAQAVIDYYTSSGIENTIFIKKSFGESNPVAINFNPDGTDNPEGRKYNRRVTFGIVNPQTGVVIRHEAFTPGQLRQSYSMRFSVVLMKTQKKLDPAYFNKVIKDDMLFIRVIETDSLNYYTLGVFNARADAEKYIEYAREQGLNDAYIVNQNDLEDQSSSIAEPVPVVKNINARRIFTIQLQATRGSVNINRIFKGYKGVREVVLGDGWYRYFYGEFPSIAGAKEALTNAKKDFTDAFIREIPISENK